MNHLIFFFSFLKSKDYLKTNDLFLRFRFDFFYLWEKTFFCVCGEGKIIAPFPLFLCQSHPAMTYKVDWALKTNNRLTNLSREYVMVAQFSLKTSQKKELDLSKNVHFDDVAHIWESTYK